MDQPTANGFPNNAFRTGVQTLPGKHDVGMGDCHGPFYDVRNHLVVFAKERIAIVFEGRSSHGTEQQESNERIMIML